VDLADKTGSELHVAFVLRTQDAPDYNTVGFRTEKTHEEEIKQMGQRLLGEQVRRVEAAGEQLRETTSGWPDQTRGSSP